MSVRILLVEDEAAIADFITRGLIEEGFTIKHASTGTQAWEAMTTSDWDLILLDWSLPGEEGLSLLHRFRDSKSNTPVMFLTARDAVSDRVIGLNAGADDYLCKPFAFEELLARVRSLTRRHDVQPSTILTFDDLQIDMANQRVDRNGHRIDLTSKEYVLLTLFIRRHGQVLSRNDIYEQVWQEPYDGISNTLEVHIKELRRKLESQGKRLIYTIRGQGYKLEAHSETA
jgi:two-component system copper resistance phosphate regulon response regulator CusR